MKSLFYKFYHKTLIGNLLRYAYHRSKERLWPEKLVVKVDYKNRLGKRLNLSNPQTLNEKINWLKINDRRLIHTICADKLEVRKYISTKIGKKYLVPLVFSTKNPSDINSERLPDFPVVVKTNHDSGGVYIIRNKKEFDYNKLQESLKKRLKINYYFKSKEWQYKNIEPKIIVEKLLLDRSGKIPMDFKVHCINGQSHMIQVDIGRGSENHHRNWYYPDWSRCPFKWTVEINGKITNPADFDIEKPSSLSEMLQLSDTLAKPFDYVRIDWYNLENQLFFGEITFHHDSGYRPIEPPEWDKKLGEMVKLGENSKNITY